MTPEDYELYKGIFVAVVIFELLMFIIFVIAIDVWQSMTMSPEAIYYFQNCNNLTLFPDGCQVLS